MYFKTEILESQQKSTKFEPIMVFNDVYSNRIINSKFAIIPIVGTNINMEYLEKTNSISYCRCWY